MDIPDALVPVKTTADAAIQTKYLKMSPDISFKPPLQHESQPSYT
jgi:hypothetical protein